MSLTQDTKGKHFTLEERFKIQFGLEQGKSFAQIAKDVGKDKSVVWKEVQRNSVTQKTENPNYKKYEPEFIEKTIYKAENAQLNYLENRRGNYKIDRIPGLMKKIDDMLEAKLHPAIIAHKIDGALCHTTIYNCIELGLLKRGRVKMRRKGHRKKDRTNKTKLGDSIELRPPEVNTRKTFGHLEGDLVMGKQGTKEVWLTLVERKTRYGFALRLPNKLAATVKAALEEFLKSRSWVKSITFDNGSEFANVSQVSVPIYFAHPYSAWERGTNENWNRLVRRELPKGRNLALFTDEEFKTGINFINNLPRKILDYETAQEVFSKELLLAS